MNGVAYVAIGAAAQREYCASLDTLKQTNPLLSHCTWPSTDMKPGWTNVQHSRWAKLSLFLWTPQEWQHILYLDADTRVRGDLSNGFALLDDGWDMALALSSQQNDNKLHHVEPEERIATFDMFCHDEVLQLQCGVMFVTRNAQTEHLFEVWREEWLRRKGQDQAAFLRALRRVPVRCALLGYCWNDNKKGREGVVVEHWFGRAR